MHTDKTLPILVSYPCSSVSICGYRLLLCVCRDAAADGLPLGLDLPGVDGLLEEVVRFVDVLLIGIRRIFQVGLLAEEEVLVSHGVIVLGIELEGFVEVLDALFDYGLVLRGHLHAHLLVLQRAGIVGLHAQFGPGFPVRYQSLGPGNHAQCIEGFLIFGIEGNQLQVPLVGIVQLLLVEEQRGDGGDSQFVLGVLVQDLLKQIGAARRWRRQPVRSWGPGPGPSETGRRPPWPSARSLGTLRREYTAACKPSPNTTLRWRRWDRTRRLS